jgi:hypothetical protein
MEAIAIDAIRTIVCGTQRLTCKWLRAAERALGRIGRRKALAITLVGVMAFGASATLSVFGHTKKPRVHDEFSYLLAADTFANGRLSNPSHPLWIHFESMHIIQQPAYASKYPPAQGLILAAGQVIGGHPIVGVWIGTALASAALCWMLLAWLPPWWAILGSLLVVLHPGILLKWGQSYWGGAVAMMGGALVFGAVRRIMRRPQVRDALLLGLGLAVLANSRPYEGLVVSLPAAVVLIAWMLGKNGPSFPVSTKRLMLPIVVVLMLTGVAMGYYNLRVTGDPLRMPYQVHESTYSMAPVFLWQRPRPEPKYHHEIIRNHHVRALAYYQEQQTLGGLAKASAQKVKELWNFYRGSRYFQLLLMLALFMLPWLMTDRWPRFALLTCGVLTAGIAMETWLMPHYTAPVAGLLFVLLLQAMRHLYVWRLRGIPAGRFLVWTLCVISVASFATAFAQQMKRTSSGWGSERARILAKLEEDGNRHLVIVRYGTLDIPYDRGYREWVYNEADIDGAKVVWARDMDTAQNRKLLEYFKDREVWLVEVDQYGSPPKLVPIRRQRDYDPTVE